METFEEILPLTDLDYLQSILEVVTIQKVLSEWILGVVILIVVIFFGSMFLKLFLSLK